jgi:hypothetical protein
LEKRDIPVRIVALIVKNQYLARVFAHVAFLGSNFA